jgi:glycosyltransferase involved in cell wall biosynthesis
MVSTARRLLVFTNDPMRAYYEKGEIKPRYYNPGEYFDEIHLVVPGDDDIAPEAVQALVGHARLIIHPAGPVGWRHLPTLVRRAERLARDVRPHALRGFGVSFGSLQAVRTGRRLGLPVVVSLHSNPDTDFKGLLRHGVLHPVPVHLRNLAFLLAFENYVMRHASVVVCKYRALIDYAVRHGASRDRIELVYNAIDVERFVDVPRVERGRRLTVVSVNRQDPDKNPEPLLRAVRDLDVDLVLVGRGSLHESLRALAVSLGIAERVRFVPSVPHAKIHECYQAADIYAVCINMVGVSMGTLEAMAAGLPVVCARTRWEERPEIVGDVALMVEPTAGAFAAAIARLARDGALRRELGAKGRELVLAIRGDVMEQRERDVYARLVEGGVRS